MNSHDIAERTRLLSHEIYAPAIDADLHLLAQANALLAQLIEDGEQTTGHELWQLILCRPWPEVRSRMLSDTPEGRLLRSNSPFSTLIGVRDPEERTRLWRQAKLDLTIEAIADPLCRDCSARVMDAGHVQHRGA